MWEDNESQNGSELASFRRYVYWATTCLIENKSFRYFENAYNVPGHISPEAWSVAAKGSLSIEKRHSKKWFSDLNRRRMLEQAQKNDLLLKD